MGLGNQQGEELKEVCTSAKLGEDGQHEGKIWCEKRRRKRSDSSQRGDRIL